MTRLPDGGDGGDEHPAWKPFMTRTEAERWAAETAYPTVVYHVTTRGAAAAIRREGFDLGQRAGGRAWGNGVYAAIDAATRDHYLAQLGRHGVALELRIRVGRVLSIRIDPLACLSPQHQLLVAIPGGLGRFIELGLVMPNRETVLTRVISEAGYDALEIRESRFTLTVGGNQIIVFDTRSIAVIDDEHH
jgi:hypothetical protein